MLLLTYLRPTCFPRSDEHTLSAGVCCGSLIYTEMQCLCVWMCACVNFYIFSNCPINILRKTLLSTLNSTVISVINQMFIFAYICFSTFYSVLFLYLSLSEPILPFSDYYSFTMSPETCRANPLHLLLQDHIASP